ncbi:MAG TPA: galactose oxidase-like domain-containing protein, partial [Mycobacterium sp.]|nr:galactose oxidase-like domain-containing protein [Mycobacterium sp.]
ALVDDPVGQNVGLYLTVPLDEDPATQGKWELLPYHSGVLAIHAAVLPANGTVMFFAGSGNNQVRVASPDYGNVAKGIYTSVVWDPQAPAQNGANFAHPDTITGPDGKPFDFFCGGDTFLADGTLLSAGGNLAYPGKGRRDVVGFEPASQKWHHRGGMAGGRWYPTLLPLADGRVLAVSGLNENGTLNGSFEIYDPATDHWHQLPEPQGGLFFGMPLYSHLFLLADGRVFFSGGRMDDPNPQGPVVLDLTTNPVTIVGVDGLPDATTRDQSASVMLPPVQAQKVMVIGGGPGDASNATGSTAVIDLTHAGHGFPAATYAEGAPMSLPRMHLNAVLLPDRTVFVSGGALAREDHVVARLQSELYDPVADEWRIGAAATVVRLYHSIALLLPDGRVVAAGGNPPPYGNQVAWEPPGPNEEQRLEVYSPPYLFAGPRPTISSVPTEWAHGQQVTIATPQAGDLKWAHLIRPGATTHSFDNSQRLVDLPIVAQGGGNLQVSAPNQGTIAPPGWYMLFVVDNAGVPSVASWIHLT